MFPPMDKKQAQEMARNMLGIDIVKMEKEISGCYKILHALAKKEGLLDENGNLR